MIISSQVVPMQLGRPVDNRVRIAGGVKLLIGAKPIGDDLENADNVVSG